MNIALGGAVCADCPGEEVPAGYLEKIAEILQTPSKNIGKSKLSFDAGFYALAVRWLKSALDFEPKTLALIK